MSKGSLLLSIILFAAGAGIGVLVGARVVAPASSGDVSTSETIPVPPAEKPPPSDEGSETAETDASRTGTEAEPLSTETRRTLGEALASLPEPDAKTGKGTIRGVVKTGDGEPLGGVLVRADPASKARRGKRRLGGGPPPTGDLEEEVRGYVKNFRRRAAERREAVSDGRGRFTLENLADGAYVLWAWREGYDIDPAGGSGNRFEPGEEAAFTARAVVRLTLDVLLPDGSRPDEADIRFKESERSRDIRSWYPDDPVIDLHPGRYTFSVTAGDDDEFSAGDQEVALEAGVEPPAITVQMKANPCIKGRVVFPENLRPQNAHVRALRFLPGNRPDEDRLVRNGQSAWVHAQNEYRFHFKNLEPGTYLLGAGLGYRGVDVTRVVEVGRSVLETELAMPAPAPADYVVVKVFGPEGDPVEDLSFGLKYVYGHGSSTHSATAIRRKDGAFLVEHYTPRDGETSEGGKHVLTVRSRELGMKEIPYVPGKDRELVVRFSEPSFVKALVAGYASSEVAGKLNLRLEKRDKDEGARHVQHYRSSRDSISPEGRMELGPVPPGPYDLVLGIEYKHKKDRRESHPLKRVPLDLVSGENEATVSIPPLYTVTVVVEDPPAQAWMNLKPADGKRGRWTIYRSLGEDGKLAFQYLPAGEYDVTMTGGMKSGKMQISVPGPAVVTFEAKEFNALRVKVTSLDGYLARAGFQDGDLAVGIDGEAFENMIQMQTLLMSRLSAESAVMNVLRGGRRVEVEFQPKKFMEQEKLGGEFEPDTQ